MIISPLHYLMWVFGSRIAAYTLYFATIDNQAHIQVYLCQNFQMDIK